MKGIALPLETVVMLILAAIVLAALLGFFMNIFGPIPGKTDIIRAQASLCQQIFTADRNCDVAKVPANLVDDLNTKVCNKPSDAPVCTGTPGQDCVRKCCSIFCPQ